MRSTIFFLMTLVFGLRAYSATDVIDFEQLPRDETRVASPYSEDGYIMERVLADPRCTAASLDFSYLTYPSADNLAMTTPVSPWPTCTEYVAASSLVLVRRPYGQAFDARAIDLSCGSTPTCSESLLVRGVTSDGQIVEQQCPVSGGALTTCGLDGRFLNLVRLELEERFRAWIIRYDNIVLESGTSLPTPWATVTPLVVDFGQTVVSGTNVLSVSVYNGGTAPLTITSVGQTDALVAPFSIGQNNCSGATIAQGSSCSFTVNFSPTASAEFTDSLSIVSNDPYSPSTNVSVKGTGVTIGGQAVGLRQIQVTCANKKRKSSVTFVLDAAEMGAWDCQAAGMAVRSGDAITMTVKGIAE